MKKLNGLQKAVANIFGLPTVVNPITPPSQIAQQLGFNQGISIYPYGRDTTYIQQGYNKNAWVYSIVSRCAKKFGQVPWYHYKVKTNERKTWAEYLVLTKNSLPDIKAQIEAKKMRKKAIDQMSVTSPLQDILNKPNRNQARAAYMENLYGYKLLTGEGNTWLPQDENGGPPLELFIIPKSILALIRGGSPWDIAEYKLLFSRAVLNQPKENIIQWRFPNYEFDPGLLTHLRGQSPLDAGLLTLQSSNEAVERMAAMNKNQGVAGAVFDKNRREYPNPGQATFIRQQFNDIINDPELAGQIGWLTGDLGYIQFGLDAGQLKLIEQSEVQFDTLCNIFDTPPGIFKSDQTYENVKQNERRWIYNNIAVAAYSLRDELNAKLIPAFGLDRDRDVIDCDCLALPELSDDMATQATTLGKLWQLTPNQVLEQLGFDPSSDPNMDKVYIPNNFQTLDDVNAQIGGNLDSSINLLNQ
jgi:HK97 family phage portal protein